MYIDMAKETNTRSDTSGNPTRASSCFPTSTQIRHADTSVGQTQIGKNMGTHRQTDKNLAKARADEYDTQSREATSQKNYSPCQKTPLFAGLIS